jgi:hypothetical protein
LHALGGMIGAIVGSLPANDARSSKTLPPGALDKWQASIDRPGAEGVPDEAIAARDFGITEATPPSEIPLEPGLCAPNLRDFKKWGLSGAGLYWLSLLVLMPIACVGAGIYLGNSLEGGILLVVFGLLPIVQLAACLLAALLVFNRHADERPELWREIGRITAYTFVGTIVGIVVMIPLLFVF